MARKIPLKTATLPNGSDKPISFTYAVMIEAVLRHPGEGGVVLDDMLRVVAVLNSLGQANGADHVVLPEDQYHTLVEKLNKFPFAIIDPAMAEFGLAIREAAELTGDGRS